MFISTITRNEIKKEISAAKAKHSDEMGVIRLLFAPTEITEANFSDVCASYSHFSQDDFDTVVIVESQPGSHEKKLPMPSKKVFSTHLGEVPSNDKLRNELCDEDDDFFIDDEAYSDELSFYSHLPILQTVLEDFSVLSLQITDESPFIVKELAYSLEEILASRNALIIFCCDFDAAGTDNLDDIFELYEKNNLSGLMNRLNSGEVKIEGAGSFFAGLLVARKWGLKLHRKEIGGSSYSVFGEVQVQPIIG